MKKKKTPSDKQKSFLDKAQNHWYEIGLGFVESPSPIFYFLLLTNTSSSFYYNNYIT